MCRPSSSSLSFSRPDATSGAGVGSGTITASVRVLMPNHPACSEALALAKASLPPSILYHSFRVFLYAQAFMRIFRNDPDEQNPQPHPAVAAAGGGSFLHSTPSTGSLRSITDRRPSSATSSTLVEERRNDDHSPNNITLSTPPVILEPTTSGISGTRPPPPFPDYILFVGCILHDVGTAPQYDSIPERFEVVGADVATQILRNQSSPTSNSISSHTPLPNRIQDTTYLHTQHLQTQQIKDLWLALSLHTSPGIAERLGGVVRAIRLAVRADLGSYPLPPAESFGGDVGVLNVVKWALPRLEIEKELGDAVVRQALRERRKAPKASWPGDLVRARDEDPGWEGVNKGF